ncbi:MAG: penicillin acylase family protein [Rhodospirillaceae bacterium]
MTPLMPPPLRSSPSILGGDGAGGNGGERWHKWLGAGWFMRRWRLAVAGVVLTAVVVPALVVVGLWLWLRGALPDYGGTFVVPGLGAPVLVVRDSRAVPRIRAATLDDAYTALGFVHAQDRLWQMEMARRIGFGRLAEVFPVWAGDWAFRMDRSMRTLGFHRLALSSYDALALEVRKSLDAYAAGVNAWLKTRRGPLPIEFQLLGYEPEPWRPADGLVLGKLQALQLSGNFRDELLRARLLTKLSPRQVEDLFQSDPAGAPVTVAGDFSVAGDSMASLFDRVAAGLPPPLGPCLASNEWVVAGWRTTSGKPVLANDPHLAMQAPVLWYLARIETPELTLSGATVPGVPFHLLGHNGTVAWGVTITGGDTQDVFVERLDPADRSRYLAPDGPVSFETRREIIKVRGGPERTVIVQTSRHGPVLPEDSPLAVTKAAGGHVLALAFTGLSAADTTSEAYYRLNRARDWDSFTAALRLVQSPQQNFVYADTGGTIGFYAPGLVPIRARGNGLVPVPGWTGAYDWTGMVPFAALPHSVNTAGGSIVNANNAVVGPDYPYLLAAQWPESWRAQRINDLLGPSGRGGPSGLASLASSVAIQFDVVSLPARMLLPLLLPREGADTLALSKMARVAVALLRRWDGSMLRDRPEPLIFSWWLREFSRQLFAERLGPLFREYWSLRPRVIEHILTEAPSWCDRPGEPGTRTCFDLKQASLEASVRALAERHGDEPLRWRWGDEHVAVFEHPLLAQVPLLGRFFALNIPADGDGYTINQAASPISSANMPFSDVHGPGLRAVYDLADLDHSLFMISTGQSGNPLSPHYRDMVSSWRDGALVSLTATPPTAVTKTMSLLPQSR